MRTYLWVMLVLLVLNAMGRSYWIARDQYPRRTRGMTVADLVFGLILVGWTVHLLLVGWA